MVAELDDPRELGNPGRSSFQVEKYPFYLLNRLVSRYNAVISARLRTIGLDIPQWRVLMILGERAPRRIAEVSDAAVINLSTMTRILQKMTRGGLVAGRSVPGDARATDVHLTSLGEEKLARARRITAPIYAQIIEGFSRHEFEEMIDMLRRLHDNLGSG